MKFLNNYHIQWFFNKGSAKSALTSFSTYAYNTYPKLQPKSIDSFLYKNVCFGYSLEVPQWGTSNEYPQLLFLSRIKKTIMWIPPLICSCELSKEKISKQSSLKVGSPILLRMDGLVFMVKFYNYLNEASYACVRLVQSYQGPCLLLYTYNILIRLKCRLWWAHLDRLKLDFILVSALQDLWDFSPDEEDYESSHDRSHDSNDDEENMETGWCFVSVVWVMYKPVNPKVETSMKSTAFGPSSIKTSKQCISSKKNFC